MATKLKLIDADAHVIESDQAWQFGDPGDEEYLPKTVIIPSDPRTGGSESTSWLIDGKIQAPRAQASEEQMRERSKLLGRDQTTSPQAREMRDIEARLRHMDMLGTDVQVLYTTCFLFEMTRRLETDVAMCRSWNRWMADINSKAPDRLRWVCRPPTLSIKDSIEQMRYSKEHGAVGVFLRPFEHDEKLPIDPYFYPILEEAERLDMPICMHIANANGPFLDFIFKQVNPDQQIFVPSFSIFFSAAVTTTHALLNSPVLDMFPKLRWATVEAASSWLPWLMKDMREKYKRQGKVAPPDLLAQRNIFVTCENEDDIGYLVSQFGDDFLMIGTDYGHPDASSDVQALRTFGDRKDVSESSKEKILSLNAKRLYNL
ncbi:MAG TPA: amidohydrolase family protein [Dehalococcoidia bacterium]|nr:amidohydrolase family protein [Dehalococcoidia bacterium]